MENRLHRLNSSFFSLLLCMVFSCSGGFQAAIAMDSGFLQRTGPQSVPFTGVSRAKLLEEWGDYVGVISSRQQRFFNNKRLLDAIKKTVESDRITTLFFVSVRCLNVNRLAFAVAFCEAVKHGLLHVDLLGSSCRSHKAFFLELFRVKKLRLASVASVKQEADSIVRWLDSEWVVGRGRGFRQKLSKYLQQFVDDSFRSAMLSYELDLFGNEGCAILKEAVLMEEIRDIVEQALGFSSFESLFCDNKRNRLKKLVSAGVLLLLANKYDRNHAEAFKGLLCEEWDINEDAFHRVLLLQKKLLRNIIHKAYDYCEQHCCLAEGEVDDFIRENCYMPPRSMTLGERVVHYGSLLSQCGKSGAFSFTFCGEQPKNSVHAAVPVVSAENQQKPVENEEINDEWEVLRQTLFEDE